jgi:hypothetical protein
MTAGQRAMAAAIIYPKPGHKSKKSQVSKLNLNKGRLLRTVLGQGPEDLAPQVISGALPLDDAYTIAKKRKKTAPGKKSKDTTLFVAKSVSGPGVS